MNVECERKATWEGIDNSREKEKNMAIDKE